MLVDGHFHNSHKHVIRARKQAVKEPHICCERQWLTSRHGWHNPFGLSAFFGPLEAHYVITPLLQSNIPCQSNAWANVGHQIPKALCIAPGPVGQSLGPSGSCNRHV